MTATDTAETVAGRPNPLIRLYRGETSFDFTGRRRWWYLLSLVVILAGGVSLGTRGFNLGIDFKGGTSWEVPANAVSTATATDAVKAAGVSPSSVQVVGIGSSAHLQVEADLKGESVDVRTATEKNVADRLAALTHSSVQQAEQNVSDVGPTWGSDITHKAVIAVIVFFIVVVVYISLRFEWKMAIAALVAVLHDLLVVAGIYSLSGLQVTPDTVVAVLTILGYSLYDTVVVFDRVGENTKGLGATGRMTYEDVVNLSMNQTLARSINTSLVAILPVLSVLVIGAQVLGATTLQYFGFALVIGLLSGAYSSIFIASPLLAQMKEREPRYATIRQRLASRAERTDLLTPRAAALASAAASGGAARAARSARAPARRQGEVLRPGRGGRPASPATSSAPAADDTVDDEPDPGSQSPRAGGGRTGAGQRPGGATGARRPPPRPRKGGGKGRKGGRRR
ncbi:MAG TPA: protein translocase subunit SecF [Acidimicrobiales bacterium]|nr:protein translocase subunit SecF [Acidimicrobiales bacterium]